MDFGTQRKLKRSIDSMQHDYKYPVLCRVALRLSTVVAKSEGTHLFVRIVKYSKLTNIVQSEESGIQGPLPPNSLSMDGARLSNPIPSLSYGYGRRRYAGHRKGSRSCRLCHHTYISSLQVWVGSEVGSHQKENAFFIESQGEEAWPRIYLRCGKERRTHG